MFFLASNHYALADSELFIGLGTFFTWISITRYLATAPEYSLIIRTSYVAIPILIKVIIGALPFVIGSAMFGLTLFWAAP